MEWETFIAGDGQPAIRPKVHMTPDDPFVYTHGDIEFTFIPYDGWQEDVRTAAAFLLTERSYSLPAKRLVGAFSPPAVRCHIRAGVRNAD